MATRGSVEAVTAWPFRHSAFRESPFAKVSVSRVTDARLPARPPRLPASNYPLATGLNKAEFGLLFLALALIIAEESMMHERETIR